MDNIIVLILAGGDSTRFWPLKEKLFTQISGRPLLYYRLIQLLKHGLNKIVIVGSTENKELFSKFTLQYPEFSYEFILQKDKRGMAGAVISAKDFIKAKKVLIVKPVDIVEDILFGEFRDKLKSQDSFDGLLTGVQVKQYFPGGYLTVKDDFLTHIIEKPGKADVPSDVVRIVFDYFKDGSLFLSYLDKVKSKNDDHYEVAIEQMVKDGKKLKVLNYKDYWGYLTYPWHILSVMDFFLKKGKSTKGKDILIAKNAIITGQVAFEDGVRVLENAKIVGPAYIGANTLIGNNCVVRESMIGANSVVGFGTEITRSYVAPNCWFHTNYIGDSVIGDNVGMGGKATIANFRLDERNIYSKIGKNKIDTGRTKLGAIIGSDVRIGVGAMIMPGIKIGKSSFVGSGVILSEDLPENKAIFVKQDYIISENREKMNTKTRESLRKGIKI